MTCIVRHNTQAHTHGRLCTAIYSVQAVHHKSKDLISGICRPIHYAYLRLVHNTMLDNAGLSVVSVACPTQ